MVSCKHCLTANSLDSTFCKHCGASLPDNEIKEAREKLDELVQTGFDLLKDGKAGEAMIIAENAVTSNPSNAAAWSLKGMCHEGRHEAAEALECYERVVELKPDSALDKIKINQLRNLMVSKATPPPPPDRKGAMLVAAAVVTLIAVGGIFVVRTMNHPTQLASNSPQIPVSNTVTQSFDTPGSPAPSQTPTPQSTANPNVQPPGNGNSQGNDINLSRGDGGGRLPHAGPDGGDEVLPVNPGAPPTIEPSPTPAPAPPTHTDEPIISGGDNQHNVQPSAPPRDPGQIQVKVHGQGGANGNSGGSSGDAGSSGNGLQAMLAAARSNFQLGHYSEAARDYSKAINMGAGRASNWQRLGDCYRQMGDANRAVDAYSSAADAFEAGGNKSGAEACRAAIKSLKGG